MALSQKHVGKTLVPWFCGAEWHLVSDKIYGNNNNNTTKREALDILNIWKARTPLLPCGVEGTFIILEATLLNRDLYDNYHLRLLLSSSIMRFLNICAAYNKYQGTFYQTAIKMKLPPWLIGLRHDAAHGQNLPALDILDRALVYCLEWLYREYWKPMSNNIKDFVDVIVSPSELFETLKTTLRPLVSNYCYIILTKHPHWNYYYVNNIADEETRLQLLEDLKIMSNNPGMSATVKIDTVLSIFSRNIESTLSTFDNVELRDYAFAEILLEEQVFLGEFEDNDAVFEQKDTIPKEFLVLWEPMLHNMHRDGMLSALIEKLLEFLKISNETHEHKTIAAQWILEISKALSKCMITKKIYKELEQGDYPTVSSKELTELLKKTCETGHPETKGVLNLSYLSNNPAILSDFQKLKSLILDNPNEYTQIFLSRLMDVSEVLKNNKDNILKLVAVFVPNEDIEKISTPEVHTVEDIINITMEIDEDGSDSKISTGEVEKLSNVINVHEKENTPENKWRKVTGIDFEKCPIGILPWQSSTMNPLLHC